MADKGPEREDGDESLSATGMFLRSFAAASPEPVVESKPTPAKPAAEVPRAEAGEFTRMFRPLSTEPARPVDPPPPVSPPVSPAASSNAGEFTRAFVVPNSASEPSSPAQSAAPKAKGFSTPGVSDSASAEGAFTRIFRPEPQPLAQPRSSEAYGREPTNSPANHAAPSVPSEGSFLQEVHPPSASPQGASITELFRSLSPESGSYPQQSSLGPEPDPVTRPYAEPTRITSPERTQVSPSGGGITELLSRLTSETPLMSGPALPRVAQQPATQPELPASAPSAGAPGEFTRMIQRAEVKAALTPPPASPPATTGAATPLVKVSVAAPALNLPVAPAPVAPAVPHLTVPPPPKVQVASASLAPPAKSKLQEMVPLLLVANGFLMLILILLVALALHRR